MTENQLQVGGFAENAHVGEHAVIYQMMRAYAVAAKFLAYEFVAPLRFFNFADHRGDENVAFQLDSCALESFHRLRVANQRALHVVNAESVDHAVLDDRLRLVADAGEKFLATGVGSIHVAVEHQAFTVPGAFPDADHIRAAFFNFLPRDGAPRFFQRAPLHAARVGRSGAHRLLARS